MRHQDLPSETRQRLEEILLAHKKKIERLPELGDCFFLEAPTLRPQKEPDHAMVAAIYEERGGLVCAKVSLEYWEASEHDYMLDHDEWSAGYPVIVEVWNSVLFLPAEPTLIHATIYTQSLKSLKQLFLFHQRSQSPPKDFRGIGTPMPEDPRHPAWAFRARESEVMERARRHLHEGWDANVVRLSRFRPAQYQSELRMAASTDDLATRLEREMEAQLHDKKVLSTPQGLIFIRRDETRSRYLLLWYSEQGAHPPEVEAEPPLTSPGETRRPAIQTVLGLWPDKTLRSREIHLAVRTEGLSRDVLIRLPARRK